MLHTAWSLMKLLRNIIPFLVDVSDESAIKDADDKEKVRRLRKHIRRFLWNVLFWSIAIVVGIKYIMPLYTENASLRHEVERYRVEIQQTQQRLDDAQKNQYIAMGNTQECNAKLTIASDEVRYLSRRLEELKDRSIKQMQAAPTVRTPRETIASNTKPVSKTPPDKPTPPKREPVLPEAIHRRLNSIQ